MPCLVSCTHVECWLEALHDGVGFAVERENPTDASDLGVCLIDRCQRILYYSLVSKHRLQINKHIFSFSKLHVYKMKIV